MADQVTNSHKTMEDRELARLASAGDGYSFAELYDRHERRVYEFCMSMLGSPHHAAEVTQETFLHMLVRLPVMEGRELNFISYTLASAAWRCWRL
jgi:DNA-directed RNA polymerase specialized sigma24 family protein